jgi:hypothetical protein
MAVALAPIASTAGMEALAMSSIDHTLDMAANIKGAFAVAIVDYDSGMTLGSRGGSPEFDLDVAAPGNSDVVRTKLEVMQKLGLRESIEDILISLDTQYHLIRPIHGGGDEKLFFYLVLNRAQANLAMARRDLRMIEQQFYMTTPSPGRPVPGQQDGQAFFPANAGHR